MQCHHVPAVLDILQQAGFGVVAFIDLQGQEIYRHLGMIRTPEEFLLLGEYIEGEHYFDTEYRTFRQARGLGEDDGARVTRAEDTE